VDKNIKSEKRLGSPSSYLPGISIDCVVIGFDLNELKILLLKMKDSELWALPGGYVQNEEDMDRAASRILEDRTGIRLPYLKQFHTFGDLNRTENKPLIDPSAPLIKHFKELLPWMEQRFITTGYLSLVDMPNSKPAPDYLSESCTWITLKFLPDLIFDHNKIVDKALEQIRNQINYLPIGISLLPEKFTMKEYQILYEEILQRKLDRANFQKKMLKLGFLDRHEKQLSGGAHKAPYLYAFNIERYNELLEKGIGYLS
jgi:8-oxo-dGTP diphosphatase